MNVKGELNLFVRCTRFIFDLIIFTKLCDIIICGSDNMESKIYLFKDRLDYIKKISDDEIINVIKKQVKVRNASLEEYKEYKLIGLYINNVTVVICISSSVGTGRFRTALYHRK